MGAHKLSFLRWGNQGLGQLSSQLMPFISTGPRGHGSPSSASLPCRPGSLALMLDGLPETSWCPWKPSVPGHCAPCLPPGLS